MQQGLPSKRTAIAFGASNGLGSIAELRAALVGETVAPGDPEYESARLVVNAAVDRRPALIVRPPIALTWRSRLARPRERA